MPASWTLTTWGWLGRAARMRASSSSPSGAASRPTWIRLMALGALVILCVASYTVPKLPVPSFGPRSYLSEPMIRDGSECVCVEDPLVVVASCSDVWTLQERYESTCGSRHSE